MLSFNEQYFNLIEEKKEIRARLKIVQDFYYDEAQSFMSAYALRAIMLDINAMQGEVNKINTQLDRMREGLTNEDLKAMKVEYDKWCEA